MSQQIPRFLLSTLEQKIIIYGGFTHHIIAYRATCERHTLSHRGAGSVLPACACACASAPSDPAPATPSACALSASRPFPRAQATSSGSWKDRQSLALEAATWPQLYPMGWRCHGCAPCLRGSRVGGPPERTGRPSGRRVDLTRPNRAGPRPGPPGCQGARVPGCLGARVPGCQGGQLWRGPRGPSRPTSGASSCLAPRRAPG